MKENNEDNLKKQQIEILKKAVALKFMTKKARERLNRIKMIKPEVAEKVGFALIQAVQTGQIKERINEAQLVSILREINETKKFNILK